MKLELLYRSAEEAIRGLDLAGLCAAEIRAV